MRRSFISCEPDEWKCPESNTCISSNQVCDDEYDCQDMSDEMNCFEDKVTPLKNNCEYQCSDGECIREGEVCNEEPDCHRGEDEEGCPKVDPNFENKNLTIHTNPCDIENGGCDHFCAQDGLTQTCSCQEGYTLVKAFACKGNY